MSDAKRTAPGLVIVDYGLGNLRSVQKAFQRVGCAAEISSSPERIAQAERLVLPGVGHFAHGMANLRASRLLPALETRVLGDQVPLLGICLGMQLLGKSSEEGDCAGLGWIDGRTVKLDLAPGRPLERVPHFGWNTIEIARENPLVPASIDGASFYFAHSYHLTDCPAESVVARTRHGVEFPSVVAHGNIFATQFHPEKSHRRGLALLARFLEVA